MADPALPDPVFIAKLAAELAKQEDSDQRLFSDRVDLEDAAVCTCTLCPPRDQEEIYDYCCRSIFDYPLKHKGQLLRDGLKANLEKPDTPCICLNTLFTEYLLLEPVVRGNVKMREYETGFAEPDKCT